MVIRVDLHGAAFDGMNGHPAGIDVLFYCFRQWNRALVVINPEMFHPEQDVIIQPFLQIAVFIFRDQAERKIHALILVQENHINFS